MSESALEQTPNARSSRVARIARWLGIAGPVLTIVGVTASQMGVAPMVGFYLLLFSIPIALLALVLGGVGLFLTRGGVGGRNDAWIGVGLGALFVAVVFVGGAPGRGMPAINDIPTNLDDPPTFSQRADRDMSFPPPLFADSYSDDQYRELVRGAYPDLKPIALPMDAEQAFAAALAEAGAQGWQVVRKDARAGTFEAEDVTVLFRFVDDIAVRVRPSEGGSVIDLRSKSRDGRGDVGANAARIRAFRDGLLAGEPDAS